MNKRELVKWLDAQEAIVLTELEDRCLDAVGEEKEKILRESGIVPLLEEYEKITKGWYKLLNGVVESSDILKSVSEYSSNILNHMLRLDKTADAMAKNLMISMGSYNCKSIDRIVTAKNSARKKVVENYDNVRYNVQRCSNAKEATAYLKELGFDVPDDVPKAIQLPAAQVDTMYLFVNKKQ